MFRMATVLVVSALSGLPGLCYGATIVNVDGRLNSSMDGSNAVNITLPAGTYTLTFTRGSFTAVKRFGGVSGCDTNGKNCVTGYETCVVYTINGTTYALGAGGGYGPIDPGDGYYQTAELAYANSGSFSASFQLAQATTVGFWFADDGVNDNSGGLSISVASAQGPQAVSYSYDALGRVVNVYSSGGVAATYAYDKAGNRSSSTVTGASQ